MTYRKMLAGLILSGAGMVMSQAASADAVNGALPYDVEFTYDSTFAASSGNTVAQFPLFFSNVLQSEVLSYTIYKKTVSGGNTVLTDVTTLGCGVTSAMTTVSSFIANTSGIKSSFIATCGSGVNAGDGARVVVKVNQRRSLILVAGPHTLGTNQLITMGWSHDGAGPNANYTQCQPYMLNNNNVQHPVWSPANPSLVNTITQNMRGYSTFVASTTASSKKQFALQCYITWGQRTIPPNAVVDVVVQ